MVTTRILYESCRSSASPCHPDKEPDSFFLPVPKRKKKKNSLAWRTTSPTYYQIVSATEYWKPDSAVPDKAKPSQCGSGATGIAPWSPHVCEIEPS